MGRREVVCVCAVQCTVYGVWAPLGLLFIKHLLTHLHIPSTPPPTNTLVEKLLEKQIPV